MATARNEDIDERHAVHDLMGGLSALGRLTEIELTRLSRDETAALAQRISEQPLETGDAGQLHDETEGNPLFVVEAVRAGWQAGHAERGWLSPKVQAVIVQRLGQLSEPGRVLVGLAATVGWAFTSDVLAHASEAAEDTLVQSLDEVWRRGIFREQGADAYDFSHDQIREVAYLSLTPARRRHQHLRVAHALERLRTHDPGAVSGHVAGHYDQAGMTEEAVTWYRRAAEAAQQLYASADADRFLSRALDLVCGLPETLERRTQELDILAAMPGPLVAVEGYASSRLADVQQRAQQLALALGVEPAPPLLRSLATASLARGDFETARQIGEQLHARGERDSDDLLLVEAEYVRGIAAFWGGEIETARRHFEAAVDRYRPEQRRTHLLWYGQDPKVVCLSRLGNTLWFLGRPEAAIQARDTALALADEIGHPYSRLAALVFAALLALDMRDLAQLRGYVAALFAAAPEDDAKHSRASKELYAGYLDVVDGRHDAGIVRIERALADSRSAESAPGQLAMSLHVLVEAYAGAGDARAGLAMADQALATGGMGPWEAEVRRLRAEFLAMLGASPEHVAAELARALGVASQQGASMLELRAAASLLRYRVERGDSGNGSEAHAHLVAALEALPEGRDTLDVQEATALLSRT